MLSNSNLHSDHIMKLTPEEQEILSKASMALFNLNEIEPSIISQATVRTLVKEIQRILLDKQYKTT